MKPFPGHLTPYLHQRCHAIDGASLCGCVGADRMTKTMTHKNLVIHTSRYISMMPSHQQLLSETRLKYRHRLTRLLVFYLQDLAREASVPVPVCRNHSVEQQFEQELIYDTFLHTK